MSLTAIGFVGIYALGLFLAFARHPIFGLFTYLWAFYNHPPARWWGADLPDFRWSLAAALITLIAIAVRGERKLAYPPWYANGGACLIVLYVIWMWIQSVWAVDGSYHLEGCILFTKYVVLFYLIYYIVVDEQTLELFFWGHTIGCFIFGWIAYKTPVAGRLESVGGPGVDDSNLLAIHLTTGLAFAGFMLMAHRGKKRWAVLGTIPFMLNGIILTLSRGAFLGMLAGGSAALYLTPRVHRRLILVLGALALALFFRLANEEFWSRIDTITSEESERDTSAQSRVALIPAQWEMAKDYPLGAGHRGNEVLSPQYIPSQFLTGGKRSAHNTFMAVLVDQGFPGAFLLIILQGWVILTLLHLKSLDRQGLPPSLAVYRAALGTAFAACFVSGQFVNLLKSEVQIWLIALLVVLRTLCDESLRRVTERKSYGTVCRDVATSSSIQVLNTKRQEGLFSAH